MTDFKWLIGKRTLLRIGLDVHCSFGCGNEFVVLEVSPSGKAVKLRNAVGTDFWQSVDEVRLVEVLDGEQR